MRVTTDLWVSALVRRVFGTGGFAAVVKRGATEAGAVFVLSRGRLGEVALYGPAPQTSYDSAKPDERFFLNVMYTTPHAPNAAPPNTPDYSKRKAWTPVARNHAAQITWTDRQIARLRATLSRLHLDDNTLVIVTSDNGPQAEDHENPQFFHAAGPFRGIKRTVYEGGIRVPAVATIPKSMRTRRTPRPVPSSCSTPPPGRPSSHRQAPPDAPAPAPPRRRTRRSAHRPAPGAWWQQQKPPRSGTR